MAGFRIAPTQPVSAGAIPWQTLYHADTSDAGQEFYTRPAWMDAAGVRGNIADKYSFFGHSSAPGSTDVQNWYMNMQAGLGHNVQGPAEGGEFVYDAPKEIVRFGNNPNAAAAVQGKWSLLNGTQYDVLDANTGKVIGQRTFEGLKDADNTDLAVAMLVGGALGGMGMTAAGAGAGAGAAGAGGSTSAMGAGAAGVTGFGDAGAMYAGLDAASAASLGGGASVAGGAALGSAAGVGGFSGAAGGAGGASAGGSGLMDAIKAGASKLLGGGGGGMSWTDFIGPALNLVGGAIQSNAAGDAADAMAGASREGIAENRRQFDTVRKLLSPYVNAGSGALTSYQALSGALGPRAQAQAINALQGSPQFTNLVQQGEDAILQNASATGGLRGGNTQDALAEFRSNVLSSLIDKQLGRMGGLATMGQNSAAGVGTAALNTGGRNAELMQQLGATQAGGILAGNNAIVRALGGAGGFFMGNNAARGGSLGGISSTQAALSQTPVGSSGFGTGLVYGNQDYGQFI